MSTNIERTKILKPRFGQSFSWHRNTTIDRITLCDVAHEDVALFEAEYWQQDYWDDFGGRPGSWRGRRTIYGYIIDGLVMREREAALYCETIGVDQSYLRQLRQVEVI